MDRSWPLGERIPPTVLREDAEPPSSSASEPVDRRCWRGSRRCQACSKEKLWLGAEEERRADSRGLAAEREVGLGTDCPMGGSWGDGAPWGEETLCGESGAEGERSSSS